MDRKYLVGHWSEEEQLKYVLFIDFHRGKLKHRESRRLWKVFKMMAIFIQTRKPNQCRSHHQKIQSCLQSVDNIIEHFTNKIIGYSQIYLSWLPHLEKIEFGNSAAQEDSDQQSYQPYWIQQRRSKKSLNNSNSSEPALDAQKLDKDCDPRETRKSKRERMSRKKYSQAEQPNRQARISQEFKHNRIPGQKEKKIGVSSQRNEPVNRNNMPKVIRHETCQLLECQQDAPANQKLQYTVPTRCNISDNPQGKQSSVSILSQPQPQIDRRAAIESSSAGYPYFSPLNMSMFPYIYAQPPHPGPFPMMMPNFNMSYAQYPWLQTPYADPRMVYPTPPPPPSHHGRQNEHNPHRNNQPKQ